MQPGDALTADELREVAAWIEASSSALPEPVRRFLALHQPYLAAEGNIRKALEATMRELRRALHIIPSSERRRPSGSPLANVPRDAAVAMNRDREGLADQISRGRRLARWHSELRTRHDKRVERFEKRLAEMQTKKTEGSKQETTEPERLDDIPLTAEEQAAVEAAADRFAENLAKGNGADPALKSVAETLMPAGAVLVREEHVSLPAEVPEDLAEARVLKTLNERRVRYDFSVTVTRLNLDVEKKVVVDHDGQRTVIAGSTINHGPPRHSVTWEALATLAVLAGQFAMPFNRLSTMLSTPEKRFGAGALSRKLHYVARRFLPVYLELATELANAEVLAGDDTSCRVLEVSTHVAKPPGEQGERPWAGYRTPTAAEESFRRCEAAREARVRRRKEGDRTALPTPDEVPTLAILIGRRLGFESARRNGDGPKEALHVSVVSGRSVADDPSSLIVLYRSHIGSVGNLLEAILKGRDQRLREVILQGDLSTTNLLTSRELLARFDVRAIGCSAHARRPFALYEDEDPERCAYMLHLFQGLAIYEERLGAVGRNRDNVLAVRGADCRELWGDILKLAKGMEGTWSKATKLGTAARYIIKHFDALTAYLDDPRLDATNNLRERMLRMEKLIESSSMFRRTLEGRFALDVVRTILQTAVAAGVSVHEYLVSVLRSSDEEVRRDPGRFTPRAWALVRGAGTKNISSGT